MVLDMVVVVLVVMSLDLFQQLTATERVHDPELRVVIMQLERFCSVPLHCSVYRNCSFSESPWL